MKDITQDEKREIRNILLLEKEIKNAHSLAALDFTTLMVLYMACTLFFASSSNKIPWYMVEEIVCINRLKSINWANVVHEYLIDSIQKFTLNASAEIMGCSLQIPVSICC